jgi:hypothetical protein
LGESETETGSEIIAAQEQANIKYRATNVLQTETYSKCRICQQSDERIGHTVSPCPILAKVQYRHVCVLKYTSTL